MTIKTYGEKSLLLLISDRIRTFHKKGWVCVGMTTILAKEIKKSADSKCGGG